MSAHLLFTYLVFCAVPPKKTQFLLSRVGKINPALKSINLMIMKSYFYTATSIQLFNASLKKGAFSGVRASCFFVLMLLGGTVWGQTNPAAQALPYTQNFSGLLASSTTYPTGWQGWQLGTGASGVFRTNAPTGDLALNGNSTASTTAGGVHNYNGKIGILQSGSNDPSLAFAINR